MQVRIRYPPKNLYGKAVKRVLTSHLVAPVQASGHHVITFRVIWRADGDALAHAWDDVVSQRHLCDRIVTQTPSLQMFVSCVSGVFTNPVRGRAQPTRPVYPAVSYWAVFDEAPEQSLALRLLTVCPSAEVKQIKSSANWNEYDSLAADCGTLFVALKDHSSDFVYRKTGQKMITLDAGGPCFRNAKLFAMAQSQYIEQLPTAVGMLKDAGLCIDLEVFEATDRPGYVAMV